MCAAVACEYENEGGRHMKDCRSSKPLEPGVREKRTRFEQLLCVVTPSRKVESEANTPHLYGFVCLGLGVCGGGQYHPMSPNERTLTAPAHLLRVRKGLIHDGMMYDVRENTNLLTPSTVSSFVLVHNSAEAESLCSLAKVFFLVHRCSNRIPGFFHWAGLDRHAARRR